MALQQGYYQLQLYDWHHHYIVTAGYLSRYLFYSLNIASLKCILIYGKGRVYCETLRTLHLQILIIQRYGINVRIPVSIFSQVADPDDLPFLVHYMPLMQNT